VEDREHFGEIVDRPWLPATAEFLGHELPQPVNEERDLPRGPFLVAVACFSRRQTRLSPAAGAHPPIVWSHVRNAGMNDYPTGRPAQVVFKRRA